MGSDCFWPPWTGRLFGPWDFPGKNTGVGCYVLLQGIFPTQGSNPGLPLCRWILYYLSHQGSHIHRKQGEWGKEWELFFLLLPSENVTQSHLTLCDPIACSFYPCNSLGKNTGVDCHSLLQELFPTQGSNLGLPHCRQILHCLSHQGSPLWPYICFILVSISCVLEKKSVFCNSWV